MKNNDFNPSPSLWLKKRKNTISYPAIEKELACDVAIIGAGITGLNTAYALMDTNLKVMVFEGSTIGLGTTGFSSAKVTYQHGVIYNYLINAVGEERAAQYYRANLHGLEIIRDQGKQGIECDFSEQAGYVYAVDDWGIEQLRLEKEAYDKLGIPGQLVDGIDLEVDAKSALKVDQQGQIDPVEYLDNMTKHLHEHGITIYENSRVENIIPGEDLYELSVNGYTIKCRYLVMASHFPINFEGLYFVRMHQERSYVLVLEGTTKTIDGFYINVGDTFCSVRHAVLDGKRVYFVGGANHQSGDNIDESARYGILERLAARIFGEGKTIAKWSNQDCMTLDGIPYIGRMSAKPRLYVGTGYNKWGIAIGCAAGEIIARCIQGENVDDYEVFNPSRGLEGTAGKELMKNAASATKGLASRLKGGEATLEEISPGEGRVIRYDGMRVGVYRDEDGHISAVRAVCTHLGCALRFNEAEKTWDCNCHGSRFDTQGKVLEGPAVDELEIISIKENSQYE